MTGSRLFVSQGPSREPTEMEMGDPPGEGDGNHENASRDRDSRQAAATQGDPQAPIAGNGSNMQPDQTNPVTVASNGSNQAGEERPRDPNGDAMQDGPPPLAEEEPYPYGIRDEELKRMRSETEEYWGRMAMQWDQADQEERKALAQAARVEGGYGITPGAGARVDPRDLSGIGEQEARALQEAIKRVLTFLTDNH